MEEVKIYRTKTKYNLMNSLVFLVLIVALTVLFFDGEPKQTSQVHGLIGFWVFLVAFTLVQFSLKLEVGKNYFRSCLLGYCTDKITKENVKVMQYGNMFRGGLGFGKGLNIRTEKNGKSKNISISQNYYGKEAIEHVKKVLSEE